MRLSEIFSRTLPRPQASNTTQLSSAVPSQTSSNSNSQTPRPLARRYQKRVGSIIGGSIAAVVAITSAVCAAWVYHKRQKARRSVAVPLETPTRNDGWTKPEIDSNVRCELPSRQRKIPELSGLTFERRELDTAYQGEELPL